MRDSQEGKGDHNKKRNMTKYLENGMLITFGQRHTQLGVKLIARHTKKKTTKLALDRHKKKNTLRVN